MLNTSFSGNERFATPRSRRSPASGDLSKNINRLLSAAIVNPRFQALLLSDPVAALAAGYNGEHFQLTPAEYAAVTSLRAGTIRDFAAELLRTLQYSTVEGYDESGSPADLQCAQV